MEFSTTSYLRNITVLILTFILTGALDAQIYVNHAATGADDGSSWTNAYTDLKTAIANTSSGEIWVAQGDYFPTTTTDKMESFNLKNNVAIYGGFTGTESTLVSRDLLANTTVLSGYIVGGESYHVVSNTNSQNNSALLDGFTIEGGNAIGGGDFNNGGGMFNSGASPTIRNCTFVNNFAGNQSDILGDGGGMYNKSGSAPQVINCTFDNNAAFSGGGMYNSSSNPFVNKCIFTANQAQNGGGIYSTSSSSSIGNCLFINNTGVLIDNMSFGGAIYNGFQGNPLITNCTIYGNEADNGSGIFNGNSASSIVTNSIITNNNIEKTGTGSSSVTFSIISPSNYPCTNCVIPIDPIFINTTDLNGPDNIYGTLDDGLNLIQFSEAINTGTNIGTFTDDILGNDRIGIHDIGVYEAECQANLIYVNANATGNNSGISWDNGLTNLQAALDLVSTCGDDTILVAQGTYYPSSSPDAISTDPKDKVFHIANDVVVIGGYDPGTGTQTGTPTILSGANENNYHVMINTGLTSVTVFEKLTFSDGNANGTGNISYGGTTFDRRFGGGIYNKSSDPIYANCVFTNNSATENGGGLYITVSNEPTLTNCIFTGNTGKNGGGVANFSSSPTLTNCTITTNTATNSGGGMYNSSSSPSITNTILWGNGSEIDGSGTPTVSYSIVEGGYTGCIDCPNTNGDIDPLYIEVADPDGLDNILGTTDDGINLMISSPAINAGNPMTATPVDITGADRTGNPDIGAYEAEACIDNLVYVSASAMGNNSGSSWTDAFNDLQDALDQVLDCSVDSILVAEGTYFPTSSPDESTANPRDRAFHLNTNVVVKGGYDPLTGNQDGEASILSGDIGILADSLDNTYHVMINTGLTAASVFENLTFSHGNADGLSSNDMAFGGTFFDRRFGGGLYNSNSNPTYSNCVFTNNNATQFGGGLYITASDATVNDCLFTSNTADKGGGLGNSSNSTSIISRSIFDSNMASSEGGGMANVNSSQSTLSNGVFINNSAVDGGGISNTGTSTAIVNCTLTANSASNSAGSIFASTTTNITNTISWGNGSEIAGTSATVSNSIIEGGNTGCIDCPNSNGDIDPLFVDAADADGLDNILGTADDGISLGEGSPAINAGNLVGAPSEDISGASRLGIVDIGAYEGAYCQYGLVFVNANATGSGNGYSWTDAYTDLQDALDQVMDCGVDSVLVAEGTYYPSSSPDEISTNPRDRAFHINSDVVVEGGYDPLTGNQDGEASILSGDIGILADSLDNTYHVMITTGLTAASVFEKLTFSDGNANSFSVLDLEFGGTFFDRRIGGGMYNTSSSPTLSDCTFQSNIGLSGGGMYNKENASPILNNCVFESNIATAEAPSTGLGGGMYNLNSSPILSFCTFTSNTSEDEGGGIANINRSPQLTNCIFTSNIARLGGGMYNRVSDPAVNNCDFTSNIAQSSGGGMFNDDSDPSVNNCTFESNVGIFRGGGIYNVFNCSPVLTHCTFISNTSVGRGGGMHNVNMCMVSLTDCTFYVPAANDGILNENNSTTTILGTVEIINNYVTDNEGNAYKTIQIGNQNWMAENLNLGTMINGMESQTDNATIEKYCYDNDPANCDIFGGLYQWDEMMQYVTTEGTQGVCPTGWHLPSDDEIKTLEMTLGMTQAEADMAGIRGTDQGSQLAGNESLWTNGALDQNAAFGNSGFAAPAGGYRNSSGLFLNQSFDAYFRSSSGSGDNAWLRDLQYSSPKVYRRDLSKSFGFSVRCVQD